MIDLVGVLTGIDSALPLLPELVGSLPALAAAGNLAKEIGANPAVLLDAHSTLISQRGTLLGILGEVAPIFQSATFDIIAIAKDFLASAARLLPQLLSPLPGHAPAALSELSVLPGIAFAKVRHRLTGLAQELVPAVVSLHHVATEVLPDLPEEVAPASAGGSTVAAPPPSEPMASTDVLSSATPTSSNDAGEAAVAAAKSQLGTPYVWGGTTPGSGFDCSGLTQWAWRQAGVELPRIAQDQSVGRPVAYEELQAGDLLVWDGHVAMYDGAGSIVEAGDPVSVNPIRTTNMGMAFEGYFRPTG